MTSTTVSARERARAALQIANDVRAERSEIFDALKAAGAIPARELLAELVMDNPRALKNIYVVALMARIPWMAQHAGETLVLKAGIPLTFTVGCLTHRQRLALGHELRMYGSQTRSWFA